MTVSSPAGRRAGGSADDLGRHGASWPAACAACGGGRAAVGSRRCPARCSCGRASGWPRGGPPLAARPGRRWNLASRRLRSAFWPALLAWSVERQRCGSGRRRPPGTRPWPSRRSAAAWRWPAARRQPCFSGRRGRGPALGARPQPSSCLPYLFTSLFLLSSAHLLADLGRAVGIGALVRLVWRGHLRPHRAAVPAQRDRHRRWRLAHGRPLDPQLAAARPAAARRRCSPQPHAADREFRLRRGRGRAADDSPDRWPCRPSPPWPWPASGRRPSC